MVTLTGMKKINWLFRTAMILLVFGLAIDSVVDATSLCHNDETRDCAVICHSGSCQTHFYQGTFSGLVSQDLKQGAIFSSKQILISSLFIHKIFHPPKIQA